MIRLALFSLIATSMVSCANTTTADPSKPKGKTQTGIASWYGPEFKKTASGERYDPSSLTAAHRTLPFGTMVRVTSLRTGRTVVVRINNRGPYRKGRIIDMSRAAAQQLNMMKSGITKVEVEVLPVAAQD